ncbi:MAG TPA: M56 family metallopeptidase, partial [Pirellulales bacterium]
LWAAGFAGGIYLQRRGRREVLSQHRRSHPMERGAVVQIVRSLAERLGLAPAPQVRCTPGGGSPCVIGGPASAVLLPLEWLRICTPNQLQLALAHELAHVRRRDLAWNQFVSVCCAALFFHPLVWLAARRYLAAQELACDALALERTNGSPIEFARLLLQFAEQPAAPQWGGVAAMTGATMTLRERIEAMTRPMKMTQTVGAKLATALLAAAGLLPVSLSAQPPADAPSASRGTESKTEDAPATESASPSVSRREKKSSSIKKSASASASASSSGMASGIGLGNGFGAGNGLGNGGTNGNGRGAGMGAAAGRADANARAKVAVSISTDEPEEEEEEPLSRFPQTSHRGSKSSVRQSMTAKNDGNGEAWSRTTEANDDGREIKIEERPDDIRMTIVENGAKQTITAKDASELEANDPEAAELYRKYASKPAAARAGGSTVSISGGGNSATKLLRDQLKEMMESEDVQGAPLQDLLKELEQQVDEAE